ncbi:MAG: hypothetical protein ABSC06_33410 [Rhodopila sp.]|jgi:hypothetical protein
MRFSASNVANAVAWGCIIGLIGVGFVIVTVLGPFGLILLGLFILFVCTSMTLREDAPTSGTKMFKARIASPISPEQRAAIHEEKHNLLLSLRFYRWCGIGLTVAGAAGFSWQQLFASG